MTKHRIRESRTVAIGTSMGMLFRARCICGWESEPVDGGLAHAEWEQHYLDSMGLGEKYLDRMTKPMIELTPDDEEKIRLLLPDPNWLREEGP